MAGRQTSAFETLNIFLLVETAYENLGSNPGQIAAELSLHFLQSRLTTRQYIKSALMLLIGWQEGHPACEKKLQWWDAGMVICLGQSADLHMAQLM